MLLIGLCVHANVRVGTRACGRVHVAVLIQHGTRMRHIVTSFVAPRSLLYFRALSHKRCDFRKNVIKHKMCFGFLYNLDLNRFPF